MRHFFNTVIFRILRIFNSSILKIWRFLRCKIRNITVFKKCLIEFLYHIWHSIQKHSKYIFVCVYLCIYTYKTTFTPLLHYTIKPFSSKKAKQKKWIQNLYKILSFKNLKIYWLVSVFLFHLPWFHRNRQKSPWYIYGKSDPVLILYIFLIMIVARNPFKLV